MGRRHQLGAGFEAPAFIRRMASYAQSDACPRSRPGMCSVPHEHIPTNTTAPTVIVETPQRGQ